MLSIYYNDFLKQKVVVSFLKHCNNSKTMVSKDIIATFLTKKFKLS